MLAAVFIYLSLSCLIRIKGKLWCKRLFYISCRQVSFMIIFIGDLVNLSCSMILFLIVLWITCEGTRLKRFTLGLMFSSAISAFNGFYDNCVAFAAHSFCLDYFYANIYTEAWLFFAIFLYRAIRFQKTERDFELSEPLWQLMLLLTLSPLGIMLSVISTEAGTAKKQLY